jgi:hypothetical protein
MNIEEYWPLTAKAIPISKDFSKTFIKADWHWTLQGTEVDIGD